MVLKLKENIDLQSIKQDLKFKISKGYVRNDYPFEINLIYKIIHEYSNYEEVQWRLFDYDKSEVEKELKSLLVSISTLDVRLTWDCLSILSRYTNLYKQRNEISRKYLRRQI